MEFKANITDIKKENKNILITLSTENLTIEDNIQNIYNNNKKIECSIISNRKKRSLDSNSYLWVLCEEIAKILKCNKEDIYLEMLYRYGVFTHIVIKPEAVENFKKEWKYFKELGTVNINGNIGIQLQIYYGSSTYDSKQMNRLLDGVINECIDLGINVLEDYEINKMKENWKK